MSSTRISAGFQLRESLGDHCCQALIDGLSPLVREPEDDDARFVQDAERENVAEVEIEGDEDAGILASAIDEFGIGGSLQAQRSNVHGVVTKL